LPQNIKRWFCGTPPQKLTALPRPLSWTRRKRLLGREEKRIIIKGGREGKWEEGIILKKGDWACPP